MKSTMDMYDRIGKLEFDEIYAQMDQDMAEQLFSDVFDAYAKGVKINDVPQIQKRYSELVSFQRNHRLSVFPFNIKWTDLRF